MEPHQQRVVDEKAELDEKIKKLETFLMRDVFCTLPEIEQSLLCTQAAIMRSYSAVLKERISTCKK